jgi:hypothetical protein
LTFNTGTRIVLKMTELSRSISSMNMYARAAALPVLALLVAGCSGGKPKNTHDKLTIPGISAPRSGVGDESFKLKIDPANRKGPGPHQLIIGVNMDCPISGLDSTSVTVDGVVTDFETKICGIAQDDILDIPLGDKFNKTGEISVHVDTSRPDLPWVMGAETR